MPLPRRLGLRCRLPVLPRRAMRHHLTFPLRRATWPGDLPRARRSSGRSPRPQPDLPPVLSQGQAIPLTTGRVPGSLGAPFQALQARFVQIMERVQEGGLQQMEHIKRPHLFTGSWMIDVASHQQLLGQTLRYVPGPEVAMRVFNLLRPPRGFPQARGDERDILSYYHEHAAKSWGGADPYTSALAAMEDEGATHAGRFELLRAVHEQRRQLEAKDELVEEVRRRADKLEAELQRGLNAEEAKSMRDKLSKAKEEALNRTGELDESRALARSLEGQVRVLAAQLREEKERCNELIVRQTELQQKIERHLAEKGAEKGWQVVAEEERAQALALRRQVEQQLREAHDGAKATLDQNSRLEGERQQLLEELGRLKGEAAKTKEANEAAQAEAASEKERLRGSLEDARAKGVEIGERLARATAQAEQATRRSRDLEAAMESLRFEEATKRAALSEEFAAARIEAARLAERVTGLEREVEVSKELADRYLQLKVPLIAHIMSGAQLAAAPTGMPVPPLASSGTAATVSKVPAPPSPPPAPMELPMAPPTSVQPPSAPPAAHAAPAPPPAGSVTAAAASAVPAPPSPPPLPAELPTEPPKPVPPPSAPPTPVQPPSAAPAPPAASAAPCASSGMGSDLTLRPGGGALTASAVPAPPSPPPVPAQPPTAARAPPEPPTSMQEMGA